MVQTLGDQGIWLEISDPIPLYWGLDLSRIFLLKSHLDWRTPHETQFYLYLLFSLLFFISHVFVVLPARQLAFSLLFLMLLAKQGGWSLKQMQKSYSAYHVWERTPRGQRLWLWHFQGTYLCGNALWSSHRIPPSGRVLCVLELGCWCRCRVPPQGAAARCCCQSAVWVMELGCFAAARVPLQVAASRCCRVLFALWSLVAGCAAAGVAAVASFPGAVQGAKLLLIFPLRFQDQKGLGGLVCV